MKALRWLDSGLLAPEVLARVRRQPEGRALRWRTWDADLHGDAAPATRRAPSRIALESGP